MKYGLMYSSLPLATLILLSTRLMAVLVGVQRSVEEGEEEEGGGCVGVPGREGWGGKEEGGKEERRKEGREEGAEEGGRRVEGRGRGTTCTETIR